MCRIVEEILDSLVDRLRSPELHSFVRAVEEALSTAEQGDVALTQVLSDPDALCEMHRYFVVIALGDARGSAGPVALRHLLKSEDADADLRSQAVIALAKRCGSEASGDFAMALNSGNDIVQEGAVVSFAGVGDDRAWDIILHRLERHFLHGTRRIENPFDNDTYGLCYLARYVGQAGSERSTRLVCLIRSHWNNLDRPEQAWLGQYWSESCPWGPPIERVAPPDVEAITAWARRAFEPYFRA